VIEEQEGTEELWIAAWMMDETMSVDKTRGMEELAYRADG